jgi:multiple sugar transport system substrate-binding protein
VADAFMAKYPNIKIDIQSAPWDDYNTKLKTLIASGDPNLYDVFFYGYNVENLVKQGVIEDLTPWAKKTGYDFSDYWPGTLDRATVNGEVYGLVRDADASLLYYNKDIFDEAKVAYPTDKWTLDDLKAAAQKLTKVESNGRVSRYGIGFEAGKVDAFLVGNGGGYLDNGTNPTKSILDKPESMAILNYFTDLISKNYAIKPSALAQAGGDAAAFQQGKVAIIIQNASRIPAFNAAKLNYDIAPLPLPPSGKRANNAAGAAWHLSAKSQHKDAAWTFLSWLQSKDGGLGIYAKQGGLFPALKSVVTSAEFTDPKQTPSNRAAFAIEGAGLTMLQPMTLPEWDDLSGTLIGPSLDKIWTLESTPDKVVPDLVTKINEYLKQKGYPKQ